MPISVASRYPWLLLLFLLMMPALQAAPVAQEAQASQVQEAPVAQAVPAAVKLQRPQAEEPVRHSPHYFWVMGSLVVAGGVLLLLGAGLSAVVAFLSLIFSGLGGPGLLVISAVALLIGGLSTLLGFLIAKKGIKIFERGGRLRKKLKGRKN